MPHTQTFLICHELHTALTVPYTPNLGPNRKLTSVLKLSTRAPSPQEGRFARSVGYLSLRQHRRKTVGDCPAKLAVVQKSTGHPSAAAAAPPCFEPLSSLAGISHRLPPCATLTRTCPGWPFQRLLNPSQALALLRAVAGRKRSRAFSGPSHGSGAGPRSLPPLARAGPVTVICNHR
jgi:hypothetical protein